MPLPLIANATKVEVRGTLFNQQVENVWYVQTADPPLLADLSTIASIFQIGYAAFTGPLSQDLTTREVFVRYVGSASGPEFTLTIAPPQPGGAVEDSMPSNVALCLSLRTALAGRRFRGRKYFSGIPVSKVVGDVIDSTLVSNMLTDINTMIADLATNGTPLSIVSYVGLTITPVVTCTAVDTLVDSQRRRLIGRGS